MKKIGLKITTMFMATLVLLSTFSFTVEKHFCGDFLVDVAYFGDADNCPSEESKKDACEIKQAQKKKKCCKDEIHNIDGQDELQKESLSKLTFKQQAFIASYAISYQLLFKELKAQTVPHQFYSPPKLIPDLQVLHEVYII